MGLFDFANICLFSEVNAVVTLDGKPAVGVEVTRTADYNDKKYTDSTITDSKGHFHFDPLFVKSFMKFTPSSPVVLQTMVFKYQGKEYAAWEFVRQSYAINEELDGNKPLKLTCELSEKSTKKDQTVGSPVIGICKW